MLTTTKPVILRGCRFFEEMPEARQVFTILRSESTLKTEEVELLKNALMRKHMTFVMKFIDHVAQEQDWKIFGEKCFNLGRRHYDYQVQVYQMKVGSCITEFLFRKKILKD
jgi:hypothetical protein